jgi:hypothetical protein
LHPVAQTIIATAAPVTAQAIARLTKRHPCIGTIEVVGDRHTCVAAVPVPVLPQTPPGAPPFSGINSTPTATRALRTAVMVRSEVAVTIQYDLYALIRDTDGGGRSYRAPCADGPGAAASWARYGNGLGVLHARPDELRRHDRGHIDAAQHETRVQAYWLTSVPILRAPRRPSAVASMSRPFSTSRRTGRTISEDAIHQPFISRAPASAS